jgi:hypothetical protein
MSLAKALDEFYAVSSLPESEVAKYWLIEKYKDKVSERLLREQKTLYKKGSAIRDDAWRRLIAKDNPWLKMIEKTAYNFAGKYIPVPLVYG